MDYRPPSDPVEAERLGKELMARYRVRMMTDCTACHR
jgi:hypothetical protein